MAALKAKYHNNLSPQRPEHIDEQSWDVFVAVVRDGQTLSKISRATGLSDFKLTRMITRVDENLDPRPIDTATHRTTIESPIESLNLSTRARNALHQAGCLTVGDILDMDFSRSVRSFGAGTRHEVAVVLIDQGFAPPLTLEYQQSSVEAIARDMERLGQTIDQLRRTIEQRYRLTLDQLARLEESLQKLAASARSSYVDDERVTD